MTASEARISVATFGALLHTDPRSIVFGWTYDAPNRLINTTDEEGDVASARTENYVYTPTTRLQQTYATWGQLIYYQDGVGNRTYDIFNDGTTTTTKNLLYPSGSNLVGSITQSSSTILTISHDGAGNIITDTRGSTTYNYRYNNRGRLDQLTIGSTVTANYGYDGLERMAVRATQNMTPSGTTHYIYDRAGRLVVEASGTGTTQREYVWIDETPLALFWPGHRRAEATPSFGRLCPAMTKNDSSSDGQKIAARRMVPSRCWCPDGRRRRNAGRRTAQL